MPNDSLFGSMDVAASAMSAERLRMTVSSENLAHAGDSRPLANGLPYARQRVLFSTVMDQVGRHNGEVDGTVVSSPRYTHRYDPDHPNADPVSGMVTEADIDPVLELTDLLVASRAYDANANAVRGLIKMHETALRLAES
jgi:flagellar basal-body rod protein FlgC